ncbi:growth-regulating factor 4-like isoform X2 [Prosopis cineraria]|nr:growth-regulating factor 4-like isoform X2 [Prosopis cineraria]
MNSPPMWTAVQPPFTVAQWQELEHQALIFKYLKAGLAVPLDLLVPIRKSLELMPPKLVHHPSLGYCSYYGKKIDPEPGRCRRTDGKKWRCSRDAHPDSKYCERHMIRRRYRSRKPVESQQAASQSSSSSASDVAASGSRSGSGSFQSLPLHGNGAREDLNLGNNLSQQIQSLPGEISRKDCRFGLNSEAEEHNFLQKGLGSTSYLGFDSTSDTMWSHISQVPSQLVLESRNSSTIVSSCFQLGTMRDAEPLNINAARSKQHFYGDQLSLAGCLKQENQSPLTFSTDWLWKDSSSPSVEYRPNKDSSCNPDSMNPFQ